MIKKIIVSTCLLFSFVTFAQEGTASPYSFFGIGDVRYKGTTEMRSMAGISLEQDSIHLNLDNPASYAHLKLTALSIGGSYNTNNLKSSSQSATTKRTTLDYLAVGLPITKKLGVGFGLVPYSSVGYKIESVPADLNKNSSRFDGKGGINKVFFGAGYKISSKWSIGADAQYSFGKIQTSNLEFVTGIPVGTTESNDVTITGVQFNTGVMFQTKVKSNLNFYSSFNYSFDSQLQSVALRNIATVLFDANYNLSVVDQADEITTTTHLKIPSTVTFGAGIGESRKWLLGAQVSLRAAAGLANSYNSLSNVSYESSRKYSLGGYYIPNYNSFTSYAKRLVYRGGLKFEKTGLVVNSQSIDDLGVTFGIGFPVTGSFSNVNLGFEIGKKGTTSSNLVQENYANFSLSLSLNDKWFEKRKFN